jgi:hypothetical protein
MISEIYKLIDYPHIVIFETKEEAELSYGKVPNALNNNQMDNLKSYIESWTADLGMNVFFSKADDLITVIEKIPHKKVYASTVLRDAETWHVIVGEKIGWINLNTKSKRRFIKIT